jgi:hypothetical protein
MTNSVISTDVSCHMLYLFWFWIRLFPRALRPLGYAHLEATDGLSIARVCKFYRGVDL